jgi:hypothetical protein
LGCLKQPRLENRWSVKAELLQGILKKIVLGRDGKNSIKDAEEVSFQFYAKKTAKNTPF